MSESRVAAAASAAADFSAAGCCCDDAAVSACSTQVWTFQPLESTWCKSQTFKAFEIEGVLSKTTAYILFVAPLWFISFLIHTQYPHLKHCVLGLI